MMAPERDFSRGSIHDPGLRDGCKSVAASIRRLLETITDHPEIDVPNRFLDSLEDLHNWLAVKAQSL